MLERTLEPVHPVDHPHDQRDDQQRHAGRRLQRVRARRLRVGGVPERDQHDPDHRDPARQPVPHELHRRRAGCAASRVDAVIGHVTWTLPVPPSGYRQRPRGDITRCAMTPTSPADRCWARPPSVPARSPTARCRPGRARSPRSARCAGPTACPFPHLPAGTESMPKIEHVVVLMMENHTFDNVLGMVRTRQRAGARGRRADAASAASRQLQPRPRRPQGVRRLRQLAVPAQRRADPGLERVAPVLQQRANNGFVQASRPGRDALLGPAAAAVHLLAGRALPVRPAVLLLGARADLSRTAASCSPAPPPG